MSDANPLFDESSPSDAANPSKSPAYRMDNDYVVAELANGSKPSAEEQLAEIERQYVAHQRKRKTRTPIILFLLTCVSTFWVGATNWMPLHIISICLGTSSLLPLRHALLVYWDQGLIYMACVLAILMTHEMGHFIATLCHRIRASLPYFLPFPINPIGTFGAVIMMDAMRADRKQMFDIGIAGPIAGLVVAVPIMWYGVATLDLTVPVGGAIKLHMPLAVHWLMNLYHPDAYEPGSGVWITQLNPYFMAGWVGLLVTGLNMIPVSQLDGGHITYTLFGKAAHWIARAFMVGAIAYIVYTGNPALIIMVILIVLIGTDHPPTKNDREPIGVFRTILGYGSLAIPILCFPPRVMEVFGG